MWAIKWIPLLGLVILAAHTSAGAWLEKTSPARDDPAVVAP